MQGQARPPVWVMGLSGASFGLVGGFPLFALAQALAARHVPETTIAPMVAVAVSPGFWSFLLSPSAHACADRPPRFPRDTRRHKS